MNLSVIVDDDDDDDGIGKITNKATARVWCTSVESSIEKLAKVTDPKRELLESQLYLRNLIVRRTIKRVRFDRFEGTCD